MRLRVDPVACDAYGYCAELLPERIWLDEWGYPVLDPGPVPPDLLWAAHEAVRACPRRALRLEATPSRDGPAERSAPGGQPERRPRGRGATRTAGGHVRAVVGLPRRRVQPSAA